MRYILFLLSLIPSASFAQIGYRASTQEASVTHTYDGSFDFAQLDRTTDKSSLIGEQLYFALPNEGTTPKPFATMTVEEPTFLYSILATEQKTVLDDPFYGKGWSIHGADIRDRSNRSDYRAYISYFYKPAVFIFSPETRNLWVGTPYSVLQDKSFIIKDCRNSINSDGDSNIVFTLQDADGEVFWWSIYEAKVANFTMVHIKRHLTQQRHDFVGKKFYVRTDANVPDYSFNILDNKEYENVEGRRYTCISMNFISSKRSGTADPFLIFEDDSGYEIAICPPGHELGRKWGSMAYYLSEGEFTSARDQQQLKAVSPISAAIRKPSVKSNKQNNRSRIAELEAQYGKDVAKLILTGRVELGMTKKMCLESWGKPLSFVESQRKGRKTETLRYGIHRWLRFTNGKLTSFSDLR